jgi:hypothetical protein
MQMEMKFKKIVLLFLGEQILGTKVKAVPTWANINDKFYKH